MKRANTIRQFISLHRISIVALSSDYLSALKVREHDAKQGLRGAFGRFRHRHPIVLSMNFAQRQLHLHPRHLRVPLVIPTIPPAHG